MLYKPLIQAFLRPIFPNGVIKIAGGGWGWAVFVSTPKGRNWFYDMFTRGLDPAETDYASLSFPSKASPYFPASEWEDARRTLPVDVFRQ